MASEQVVLLVEFAGLALAAASLFVWQRRYSTKDPSWAPIRHHSSPLQDQFDKLYLIVYLLGVTGDALQVAWLPSLFAAYGYSSDEIRTFSIVALTATAIPGVVLASCADTYGRRKAMQSFAVLYLVATVLTTDASMSSLVASRLFAGVAGALFGSVFESWFVRQHRQAGFHVDLLSLSFSVCITWAGLALILSQLVGHYAVHIFGRVGPVYVSGLIIGTGLVVVSTCCPENYGDKQAGWQLPVALKELISDRHLRALAVSQALVDSVVALVSLSWPTALGLQPATRAWIGSYFLVCTVIGSVAFAHVVNGRVAAEKMAPYVSVSGAGALAVAAYFPQFWIRAGALFVFQVCAGLYWPSQATLRSKYVPEARRATMLALFRCPVAMMQIVALLHVDWFESEGAFWLCAALLALASLNQQMSLGPAETKLDVVIAVDAEMATA